MRTREEGSVTEGFDGKSLFNCIEESVLRRADGAIILGNWLV